MIRFLKYWIIAIILGNYWIEGMKAQNTPSNPTGIDPSVLNQLLDQSPHKLLIIGRWRGFHQTKDQTLYYLYEFNADRTYRARYRWLSDKEKVVREQFWQGTWDFDGKLVKTIGSEVSTPEVQIELQFRLANDNFLYREGEEDNEGKFPQKMAKQ